MEIWYFAHLSKYSSNNFLCTYSRFPYLTVNVLVGLFNNALTFVSPHPVYSHTSFKLISVFSIKSPFLEWRQINRHYFLILACRPKPTTTCPDKMLCLYKFNTWLMLQNPELANSIVLMDNCISTGICRKHPLVWITTVCFINYQLCYPKGFLSFSSCILSSCKLGVHFHYYTLIVYANVSDTLGKIIFIHLLRSTVTISLSQSNCLPRYCPVFILKGFTDFAQ